MFKLHETTFYLQELLNKSRATVSMAFQTLQKMRSHTIGEYMCHVVSDLQMTYELIQLKK